jgi:hypothetical protein
MQHNFMPGNVITHNKHGIGEVLGRGADRGRYWVQVRFISGKTMDFVNNKISELKHS